MNDTPTHSSGSERIRRSALFELQGAALKAAIDRMVADLEFGEGQLLLRAGLRLEKQALRCVGPSAGPPAVGLETRQVTVHPGNTIAFTPNPSND